MDVDPAHQAQTSDEADLALVRFSQGDALVMLSQLATAVSQLTKATALLARDDRTGAMAASEAAGDAVDRTLKTLTERLSEALTNYERR